MFTRRLLLILAVGGILTAQEPPATLQVTGAVKQTLNLTADDLAKMPRASVNLSDVAYQGVWLHEVLKRAGVPQAELLRGKALAGYLTAEAQDGYRVVFSLAEVDPSFIDSEVLVADTANGKPLSGTQGRFRLVVPKDKPGARSVRMLTKIEVVQLLQ